jgi:ectoine hydroxylase-related dioxygenase (phytanoyl-CoA dioxygenase family)
LPLSFGVQGVLYLTDTLENQGGFQCIPGIHHQLTDFGANHPLSYEYEVPDLKQFMPQAIPGKAGDLLIWHRALAHGSGHNTSDNPRLAQYISMRPARPEDENSRQKRIHLWKDREEPPSRAFPGDPRGWEKERPLAELTPLGKKLLGLDAWE